MTKILDATNNPEDRKEIDTQRDADKMLEMIIFWDMCPNRMPGE